MDATETIVTEIRATRDATPTHAAYDLATFPPGLFPGVSMADLVNSQNHLGQSTASLLTEIRDLLLASGEGSEAQIEALGTIITLLA